MYATEHCYLLLLRHTALGILSDAWIKITFISHLNNKQSNNYICSDDIPVFEIPA